MRIRDWILISRLVIVVFRGLVRCKAAIIVSATIVQRRTKTRRRINRVIRMRVFGILGVRCATFSRTPLGFTICDASLSTPVLPFEKDGVQFLLFAVYPVRRRVEQAAQRGLDSGGLGGGGAGRRRLLGHRAGLGGGPLRLHFGDGRKVGGGGGELLG